MTEAKTGEAAKKPLFTTQRTDNWQKGPLAIATVFTLFIIYATWRTFENQYFEMGNLLSPFYSPKIEWHLWTKVWHLSPAILILWIPAGFRATCYYYRKAYYRSYFMTPPACGVSGYKGFQYQGETKFPFVFQNLHRYMFYLATLVLAVLWWDALQTLFAAGHFFNFGFFQVSVGTLVYFVNVVLLSNYSFGCHAFRHLIGGRLDCFSCGEPAKTSLSFWEKVTKLNEHHQLWAWCSLFSVAFADFYTRCVASNAWTDQILFQVQQVVQ
ncbi:MAG: hypothetical protein K2X27_01895 [Candidatus Obscuribacterales bacterium]|nr:hypothetical protein [Candidatus Obscuribacterales bacterium]